MSNPSIETSQTQAPQFMHLRCHSEYSIIDGIVRIDDYVAAASKDAMQIGRAHV